MGAGWEEDMVQGGLQSSVGKWRLGTGRFPTSGPNYWGGGMGVALVRIHLTPLCYPGMGNPRQLAGRFPQLFTLRKK